MTSHAYELLAPAEAAADKPALRAWLAENMAKVVPPTLDWSTMRVLDVDPEVIHMEGGEDYRIVTVEADAA
jgi:hypothetical protein